MDAKNKIKVCLDLRMIAKDKFFGTGQYVYNLIEKLKSKVDFTMLLRKEIGNFLRIQNNFPTVRIDTHGYYATPENYIIEQTSMKDLIETSRCDVYHATYNWGVPKLNKIKSVLTIHDLIPIKNKRDTTQVSYESYLLSTKTSINNADKIITVSKNSKKDIIDIYKVKSSKINVIYNGFNDFSKIKGTKSEIDLTLNRFKINGDYIIYSGGIGKRKNLEGVVEVFNLIIKQIKSLSLVIVGDTLGPKSVPIINKITKIINNYDIKDKVIFTNYIDEKNLANLVSAAKIMLYPSRYEGFGIPILESMSVGTPVITSNRGALPEISGPLNPKFGSDDYSGMSREAIKIINDSGYSNKIIKAGYSNCKKYSWDKMAKETLELYHEIIR